MLRSNRSDEGLKLTQQLLCHASISTRSSYLNQNETEKLLAAREVNPIGEGEEQGCRVCGEDVSHQWSEIVWGVRTGECYTV